VSVLWSVSLSRLLLGVLASVLAVRAQVPDYAAAYTEATADVFAELEVAPAARWQSRAAAVVLLVVWVGLEAVARLDPGWRRTVRRLRSTRRPLVGPALTSVPVAQVTGLAAGATAVSAALLLVAEPLPEYLGDLSLLADPALAEEVGSVLQLGPVVAIEVVTLGLLAAGLLVVGSPAAVGRTLTAAAGAGLAAGLVTVGIVNTGLYGFGVHYVIGVVLAWITALLLVGGLAVTPVCYRLRRWLTRVLLRRPDPA